MCLPRPMFHVKCLDTLIGPECLWLKVGQVIHAHGIRIREAVLIPQGSVFKNCPIPSNQKYLTANPPESLPRDCDI